MSTFQWSKLVDELSLNAPTLLHFLSTIVTHSDHRNKLKVASAYDPGCYLLFLCIQVYSHLNQVGLCVSYPATLVLLDEIAKLHTAPMSRWLATSTPFMFWRENVDKQRSVRDMRSDHRGSLLHMYSILAGSSRTTDPTLNQHGRIASISSVDSISLLPTSTDISSMRSNLIVIVARLLTQYIKDLKPLSRAVASHIQHEYSQKSLLNQM